MGVNATLSVVSESEYRKFPQTNPVPSVEFDLWKGWGVLDLARPN